MARHQERGGERRGERLRRQTLGSASRRAATVLIHATHAQRFGKLFEMEPKRPPLSHRVERRQLKSHRHSHAQNDFLARRSVQQRHRVRHVASTRRTRFHLRRRGRFHSLLDRRRWFRPTGGSPRRPRKPNQRHRLASRRSLARLRKQRQRHQVLVPKQTRRGCSRHNISSHES